MNKEYLWDRSGNDPETARLEDLLSDFRYVPVAAPQLKRSSRKLLWRLLPVTAMALSIIAIVWMVDTRSGQPPASNELALVAPVIEPMPAVSVPKGDPIADPPATIIPAVYRMHIPVRPRHRRANPVHLTVEEKHAYDQVVLALFITGSQLKTVHDRIDGIENNKNFR